MPRYHDIYGNGYCLDTETPFYESREYGKICLGSAGGIILACRECGNEQFRDRVTPGEWCVSCGFDGRGVGDLVPLTFDNRDWFAKKFGWKLYSVDYKRKRRLEKEENPKYGGFKFGNKTEADFPNGYMKKATMPEGVEVIVDGIHWKGTKSGKPEMVKDENE